MPWHETLTHYLESEFCHSAGDYEAARRRLIAAGAAIPSASKDGLPLTLMKILGIADELNELVLAERNAAVSDHRHPSCPHDLLSLRISRRAFDYVHMFYALGEEALSSRVTDEDESLWTIRRAILRNYDNDAAERIGRRFAQRREAARTALGTKTRDADTDDAAISAFLDAGFDNRGAVPVPAFVLSAFFQAHIIRFNVEHDRSVPVGKLLGRTKDVQDAERALLQQSVVLLTFSFTVCLTFPWVFCNDEHEREAVMTRLGLADRSTTRVGAPDAERPLWLASQLMLLSVYRRAHVFRLLGEHQRSYNDLRKVQRMTRDARVVFKLAPHDARNKSLNTLEMLGEYRVGELYRADHDASQALLHLCRSHDLVTDLQKRAGVNESALFQVHIRLSKGKAFLETGAVKRALKWFVRAWIALRGLVGITKPKRTPLAVRRLDDYLETVKHAPELDKTKLLGLLGPAVNVFCRDNLPDDTHDALVADVLIRLAHVLLVLRLEANGRSTHAEKLLKRAVKLDEHNLLAWGGLWRCELRGMKPFRRTAPNAMDCWPSGATDIDQAIRAGEHLMLKRVRDSVGQPHSLGADSRDVEVARALLNHFHTHTDSINLRLGILHRYLMQQRSDAEEERQAQLAGSDSGEAALEFVCLRRYGSFHPLMPRPAAVSAVGGGYLLRVFAPFASERTGHPGRAFNVLIDPGDGVISNLYRAGLAISDIDMVIATHDHPDHLAALDAILSLRHERVDRLSQMEKPKAADEVAGPKPTDSDLSPAGDIVERMLILGNRSVVNRYSFLNGGDCVVMHIADASAQRCPQISQRRIVITALPTRHPDLGGHNAVGFIFALNRSRRRSPSCGSHSCRTQRYRDSAHTRTDA